MPVRAAARKRLRQAGTYGLAPLGRMRARSGHRFVIYCPGRTGSQLLASLLDAHPSIRCEGEILTRQIPQPLAWFDGRAALSALRGHPVWGCKVKPSHLAWRAEQWGPPGELLRRLVDLGYTLVCIRRRDWLLQALSVVHGARTKYHFTVDDEVRFTPMTVDPVELLHCLYAIEVEDEMAVETVRGLPHVELWYEDDLQRAESQAATLNRLTDAFSLPRVAAQTALVAGAPPTVAERVANLDEVADVVGRTRFGRFLD